MKSYRICKRIKSESSSVPEINDIASYWWEKFNSSYVESCTCWLNRSRKINPGDYKLDMECNGLLDVLDNLGVSS